MDEDLWIEEGGDWRRAEWRRPPSRGNALRFTVVTVMLIAGAIAGTALFIAPQGHSLVSTTTLTSADMRTSLSEAKADEVVTTPVVQRVASPWELPDASRPDRPEAPVNAVARVTLPRPAPTALPSPAPSPRARVQQTANVTKPTLRETASAAKPTKPKANSKHDSDLAIDPRAEDRALPDLDHAAAAVGLTPAVEASSSPSEPTGEAPPPANLTATPSEAPPPSEVLPGLQLER